MALNVRLGPNSKAKLVIRKGENINKVVSKFASEHKLDKESEVLLKELLEAKLSLRMTK